MHSPGASFVTLTIDDQLRGCIGSLTAYRPLVDDIRFNAFAAAFEDPRFYPLTTEEYDKVAVEVSLLSVPETMPSSSRDQVLSSLRPGIDGVILTSRRGRTTVLPQVWEDYPTPAEFLDYLLTTAGLKPDYWGNDISIERYHVSIYDEGH
jgi:AmmeMemoRadiSam system protein A